MWLTAQWTGRDLPRDTPVEGPLLHANGMNCLQWCKVYNFFPSVALGAGEKSARLSENRAVETWNSLIMTSLRFYFEGFGSGMRSSFQRDYQEKLETSASSTKQQEKERIVQNRLLSPFLFVSTFSLSLCSLRLALDCSRGNHHHAVLQRIVAAPPGLPEDALLPLVPLLGRRTLEVSTIQVGATAIAKPPAT